MQAFDTSSIHNTNHSPNYGKYGEKLMQVHPVNLLDNSIFLVD